MLTDLPWKGTDGRTLHVERESRPRVRKALSGPAPGQDLSVSSDSKPKPEESPLQPGSTCYIQQLPPKPS